MAKLLWGIVNFKDQRCGILRHEANGTYQFQYDLDYLNAGQPAIAHHFPLQEAPFVSEALHPYFDNLVAEGWLEAAQARLLGRGGASRFALLLAFGADCAGAVSIHDPDPTQLKKTGWDSQDAKNVAVFRARASLSGIQPKLALVQDKNSFRVTTAGELSTHIAKLPSLTINDIVANEYLTTLAVQALLPDDQTVKMQIAPINDLGEALVIERFDRAPEGQRIHFEEFNQLLNLYSYQKYNGAYKDMADFIWQHRDCLPAEVYLLFQRVLAGILTGNTDMHFKNFSMLHTSAGLRLTPNYDQVAAAVYKDFQVLALEMDRAADRVLGQIRPKNIIAFAKEFALSQEALMMAIDRLGTHLPTAIDKVMTAPIDNPFMKNRIKQQMEKRWNGLFSSIGKALSKKQ